jgi:hypothetical protein
MGRVFSLFSLNGKCTVQEWALLRKGGCIATGRGYNCLRLQRGAPATGCAYNKVRLRWLRLHLGAPHLGAPSTGCAYNRVLLQLGPPAIGCTCN